MQDHEAATVRATMTIDAGTVLYHGTDAEFDDHRIEGPCWFSRSRAVAERFARQDGRVISFCVDRPTSRSYPGPGTSPTSARNTGSGPTAPRTWRTE